MKKIVASLILLCLAAGLTYAQQTPTAFPKLTGPYLDQKPPGKTAEPFAPNIIATQHNFHGSVVFSPDGNEAYWSVQEVSAMIGSKRIDGIWTRPEPLFPNSDVPFVSPDGNRLFFISKKLDQGTRTEVISVLDRTPAGWSAPRPLPAIINSIPNIHWQLSVDSKGNLYFGARQNARATSKVYCSEFVNGTYRAPRIVEELKDVHAFSPFIAPDGSYLIVTELRDDLGLHILFRKPDGTLTKGKNIAENIGATGEMLCPVVTHDGKYMFFLKGVADKTVPYWVDASFIEELRKTELAK